MRSHTATWEPNENEYVTFKASNLPYDHDYRYDEPFHATFHHAQDERVLDDVRALSALFRPMGVPDRPSDQPTVPSQEEPLEVRVANISADIAAAIAQANSRVYEEEEDVEEQDEDSSEEENRRDMISLTTSGIRDEQVEEDGTQSDPDELATTWQRSNRSGKRKR